MLTQEEEDILRLIIAELKSRNNLDVLRATYNSEIKAAVNSIETTSQTKKDIAILSQGYVEIENSLKAIK